MKSLTKLNIHGFGHILALVGVVVVTAVIGTYLIVSSHAASTAGYSTHCHSYTFSTADKYKYIPCVVDIQAILKNYPLSTQPGSPPLPAKYYKYGSKATLTASNFVDGQYGTNTANQVRNLQAWNPVSTGGADGVVGKKTWSVLCWWAQSHVKSVYKNACT